MCVQNQAKGQDLFFHTTGINDLIPNLTAPITTMQLTGICKDQGIADLPNFIHVIHTRRWIILLEPIQSTQRLCG